MKPSFFTCLLFCLFPVLRAQVVKEPIPDRVVVLTFDDACASHYSYVAPLLKQLGFGATFFVCEFPPNFADSSKYMSWNQMKELDQMGFEVANHTRSHPSLPKLSREQVDEELDYIDRKCEEEGMAKPVTFAYPGYGLSPEVLTNLAQRNVWFARMGGRRAYDPQTDHPLLIPSWDMKADNRDEIMASFQQAKGGRVVVLTIHGVPDAEHPWVTTPPELFNEYMHYLAENGYTVIALRDMARYVEVNEAHRLTPDYTKPLVSR